MNHNYVQYTSSDAGHIEVATGTRSYFTLDNIWYMYGSEYARFSSLKTYKFPFSTTPTNS